jgi:hypothetical protein
MTWRFHRPFLFVPIVWLIHLLDQLRKQMEVHLLVIVGFDYKGALTLFGLIDKLPLN